MAEMRADEMAAKPGTTAVAAAAAEKRGRVKVLLVDDHAVVRKGLASLIGEEPDMEVCGEAEGVRAALDAIRRDHPRLAVVDISLKDGDGLELVRQIVADHPDVLPLVLSMYDESVYAERALRAGARGYVRKVAAAETLMTAIRTVLAGDVYVSPTVAAGLLQKISGGRRHEPASPAEKLSDRELQVLRCIGRGLSNREVADELFISVKTVESHREHMKQKLALSSNGDLLRYAIEFTRSNG